MPLQQISVSPLDWSKESANIQRRQDHWKIPEPVFTTSGSNPLERCPSQSSTLSNNNDICRICHCEGDEEVPLIAPCYCAGSLRYVHQACLQQWIKSSDIRSCELCKFQFIMQSKLKPMNQWESLDMSGVERRKLLCSVTFHAVALTCVVWSLYVLIDRTADEVQRGVLEWPFWTKLIVVAIGFTGGVVFMYIQCKAYLHLCRRWRAFNRVIYVQNVPEKVALPPAAPTAPQPPPPPKDSGGFGADACCGVRDHRRLLPIVVHKPAATGFVTAMNETDAACLGGRGERRGADTGATEKDDVRIAMATGSGALDATGGCAEDCVEARGGEGVEETSRLLSEDACTIQIVPAAAGSGMRRHDAEAAKRGAAEGASVQIVQRGDGTKIARVRSATDQATLLAGDSGGVARPRTAPGLQSVRGAERRDV